MYSIYLSIEYKVNIDNFKGFTALFNSNSPILTWLVYLLECADGTYYAGITNRLEHRLAAHNCGQGARYTRSRRPVILLASQEHPDRSEASKAESRLKQLPRAEKLAFFKS